MISIQTYGRDVTIKCSNVEIVFGKREFGVSREDSSCRSRPGACIEQVFLVIYKMRFYGKRVRNGRIIDESNVEIKETWFWSLSRKGVWGVGRLSLSTVEIEVLSTT